MRHPAPSTFLQTYGYPLLGAIWLGYLVVISLQPSPVRSPWTLAFVVCAVVAGSTATSHVPRRLWVTVPLALLVLLRVMNEILAMDVKPLEISGQLWFWWVTGCMVYDVIMGRLRVIPRLLAAGSLYVMAAMGFSEIYSALNHPDAPPAFAALGETRPLTIEELVYFSFVTQTTLGYGDIVPVSPPARTVAVIQATAGVLYLAVLVASIVNARDAPPKDDHPTP